MINWVNAAQNHRLGSRYSGCTSFTKAQDQMMRICSLNHVLTKHSPDAKLNAYLALNAKDNQYLNVTMRGIRDNARDAKQAYFFQ